MTLSDTSAGPEVPLGLLEAATARLASTVVALEADDLVGPSRLPGWSRAHVLTHVARNADGLRNLLLAARSGVEVRVYASLATRHADIEAGATRPPEVVVADVLEASRRILVEAAAMPAGAWAAEVVFGSGQPGARSIPAGRIAFLRLCEVEIHHVDLATAYGFADTPEPLAGQLLAALVQRAGGELVAMGAERATVALPEDDVVRRCSGAPAAVLSWVTGRSEGAGVAADGPLPPVRGLG